MTTKKSAKKIIGKQAKKPAKTAPATKIEAKAPASTPSGILRWKAPDYYTFERSPYWSLGIGALAIVFSMILIFTQNYFPVIIIILAVIVSFQLAHDEPKTQEFALDESGILCRNNYITFSETRSFWIAKHGTKSILYIEPASFLRGPIMIPLGQQNENEVRYFMLRYLPEKFEAGELMSEKLIRIFKL